MTVRCLKNHYLPIRLFIRHDCSFPPTIAVMRESGKSERKPGFSIEVTLHRALETNLEAFVELPPDAFCLCEQSVVRVTGCRVDGCGRGMKIKRPTSTRSGILLRMRIVLAFESLSSKKKIIYECERSLNESQLLLGLLFLFIYFILGGDHKRVIDLKIHGIDPNPPQVFL